MATILVTFFLIVRFNVCKMDAESFLTPRARGSCHREKRWSMNSHRLEQIIAELIRPVRDIRYTFDTDLGALLEEYLTEAGLRALDDIEDGSYEDPTLPIPLPNFSELALLLQHSANLYGRKVDLVYQQALSLSDSLHNNTIEQPVNSEETQTPSSRGRKRKHSNNEFESIVLEECAASRREQNSTRPPPTLPRLYLQLEPRVLTACDVQLTDYEGEPIGMLHDLHVTWRLQEGLLVEELAEPPSNEDSRTVAPCPLPLEQLQPTTTTLDECSPLGSPPHCSTPLPIVPTDSNDNPDNRDEEPQPAEPQLVETQLVETQPVETQPVETLDLTQILKIPHKQRKRKSQDNLEDMGLAAKLIICEEHRIRLQTIEEFCIPDKWIRKIVERRKRRVLDMRRRIRAHEPRPPNLEFRGFDVNPFDVGGFLGWSSAEAAAARAAAKRPDESDDDGFFEQSSLGDSHGNESPSHNTTPAAPTTSTSVAIEGGSDPSERRECWNAWQAEVVKRATLGENRVVDIQATAARLLEHVQHEQSQRGNGPVHCTNLLSTAEEPVDVSRLFLGTLFLANAGNIEIIQGAPLSLNSFSVVLVSTDERLYRAVASAEQEFLR